MSMCILGISKKSTLKCVILNTLSVCVCVKANARCVCVEVRIQLARTVLSFGLVHPRREPGYQACGKAPLSAGPDKRVFGVCVSMLDVALYSSS